MQVRKLRHRKVIVAELRFAPESVPVSGGEWRTPRPCRVCVLGGGGWGGQENRER